MLVFYCTMLILTNIVQGGGTNEEYYMDSESCTSDLLVVKSAIVRSQHSDKYYSHGNSCTMQFQTSLQNIEVKVQELDIYPGIHGNCSEDYLTIISQTKNGNNKVMNRVCGGMNDLPQKMFTSADGQITLSWVTSANSTAKRGHLGFKLQLKSFTPSEDFTCSDDLHLCALYSQCIPRSLVCDGIKHCMDGSDERQHCTQPTTSTPMYKTTNSADDITESETFWFISMLGIIVISILGAIIAVIRRKHIERRDNEMNSHIQDCQNEDSDEVTYNRQESVLSTGSASNNVEQPPEYDVALTCSSDPVLPPSYSEVDFEGVELNGTRNSSTLLADSPLFGPEDISPNSNNVFILDILNSDQLSNTNVPSATASKSNAKTVRMYLPSESTISEEDENHNARL